MVVALESLAGRDPVRITGSRCHLRNPVIATPPDHRRHHRRRRAPVRSSRAYALLGEPHAFTNLWVYAFPEFREPGVRQTAHVNEQGLSPTSVPEADFPELGRSPGLGPPSVAAERSAAYRASALKSGQSPRSDLAAIPSRSRGAALADIMGSMDEPIFTQAGAMAGSPQTVQGHDVHEVFVGRQALRGYSQCSLRNRAR